MKSGPGLVSIRARERERSAVELRKTGASYEEIGSILHCSASAAAGCVKRSLQRIIKTTSESAEHIRVMELAKLDQLESAHWAFALKADDKSSAIILRCMQRRAALLGLDAALKVEVDDTSGIDDTLARLIERLKSSREIPAPMETVGSSRTAAATGERVVQLALPGG